MKSLACLCKIWYSFIHQRLYSPSLGLFFSSVIFLTRSVELLGRVINPSQGRYLLQDNKNRKSTHRRSCLQWDSNPRFLGSKIFWSVNLVHSSLKNRAKVTTKKKQLSEYFENTIILVLGSERWRMVWRYVRGRVNKSVTNGYKT
jgi:hypothetical protein